MRAVGGRVSLRLGITGITNQTMPDSRVAGMDKPSGLAHKEIPVQ